VARKRRPSESSASWRHDGIRIEINKTKLKVVARRELGDELESILDRIARQAKVIVERPGNHPYSKTGRMRESIGTTPIKGVNQYSVTGSVTAGGDLAPYAVYVHEGTRPHVIKARPENPTGMLRFYWVKRGTYVTEELRRVTVVGDTGKKSEVEALYSVEKPYAPRLFIGPKVNHPGQRRPKPFLIKAARDITGYTAVRRS